METTGGGGMPPISQNSGLVSQNFNLIILSFLFYFLFNPGHNFF